MNTLIIDDNKAARTLLKSYIRQYDPTGHIHEAATTQSALAKLRQIDYIDIVTLDQNLGEKKKGLDLLSHIHELKPNSHIIMITNECTSELRQATIEHGIEFVCKPINSSKLKKFFVT